MGLLASGSSVDFLYCPACYFCFRWFCATLSEAFCEAPYCFLPQTQTSQACKSAFRLFLAFLVFTGIVVPHAVETVVMYLEFLAVNDYRACLLKNHVSILHHYFSLFNWPTRALHALHRQVTLFVKSVQINVKLHI